MNQKIIDTFFDSENKNEQVIADKLGVHISRVSKVMTTYWRGKFDLNNIDVNL